MVVLDAMAPSSETASESTVAFLWDREALRRSQQSTETRRTGLSERKQKLGASKLRKSLYARADSSILWEKWTSCFPYSSVCAEDAEYGIGRVDWKKLLRQQKWEWPGRNAMGKAADREPNGVLDTQRASQEEQPETPQVCCSGGGDDHGPLRGNSNPVTGEKILQALGQERTAAVLIL